MNKTELIDAVAKDANITKADAAKAVAAITDSITKALKKGDSVTLIGFGTFVIGLVDSVRVAGRDVFSRNASET